MVKYKSNILANKKVLGYTIIGFPPPKYHPVGLVEKAWFVPGDFSLQSLMLGAMGSLILVKIVPGIIELGFFSIGHSPKDIVCQCIGLLTVLEDSDGELPSRHLHSPLAASSSRHWHPLSLTL